MNRLYLEIHIQKQQQLVKKDAKNWRRMAGGIIGGFGEKKLKGELLYLHYKFKKIKICEKNVCVE